MIQEPQLHWWEKLFYFTLWCFIIAMIIPIASLVFFLTGTWYGSGVYGALYHRSELGKWPPKEKK
jgi:hypothetical protein